LMMSRDSIGESYNNIVKIIVESHKKIKRIINNNL